MGLWRMDEEPVELLVRYPHLRRLPMAFKSVARQKEFLCVRALLLEMSGDDSLCIDHEASGRPVICGGKQSPDSRWPVSISHTQGYAVLMLSQPASAALRQPAAVGVDIEYRSDRILKIASHFIRPDEMVWDSGSPTAADVEQMLILWCAKETLYKLHSDDNLHFSDMRRVAAAVPVRRGEEQCADRLMTLENMKRGERVTVHVTLTPEYCLTWAVRP